jgi:hypothetical protein
MADLAHFSLDHAGWLAEITISAFAARVARARSADGLPGNWSRCYKRMRDPRSHT